MVAGGLFADAVMHPVHQPHLSVASSSNSNFKFWILTKQTYYGGLTIPPPSNLDRTTFDLISGCTDYAITSQSPARRPKWIIKSTSDQQVVIQGEAILYNPPANECATSGGYHLFSLGEIALGPGRYQLELKFSDDLPESASIPVSLGIGCCGKNSKIEGFAGNFPLLYGFVLIPASAIAFAVLVLILLIRGGRDIYPRPS
jgi:hypothetical protein